MVYDQWYQCSYKNTINIITDGAIGYAIKGALFSIHNVIFIYGSVLINNVRNANVMNCTGCTKNTWYCVL
nr:hypothetical protein [Mycoplasmopsis bovis]